MKIKFIIRIARHNFFLTYINIRKKTSTLLTAGAIGCRGKFKKKKETLIRMLNKALTLFRKRKISLLVVKCYGFLKYRRAFLKTLNLAVQPFFFKKKKKKKKKK